ncbi:uncharacterized protein V1518DRAFT_453608 [Limtongia smithiae]|uniref:uncharacterized protein n=1 Tax=Limtongia smithiae TaxID=1125753 RepID=UPI0034CDDA69
MAPFDRLLRGRKRDVKAATHTFGDFPVSSSASTTRATRGAATHASNGITSRKPTITAVIASNDSDGDASDYYYLSDDPEDDATSSNTQETAEHRETRPEHQARRMSPQREESFVSRDGGLISLMPSPAAESENDPCDGLSVRNSVVCDNDGEEVESLDDNDWRRVSLQSTATGKTLSPRKRTPEAIAVALEEQNISALPGAQRHTGMATYTNAFATFEQHAVVDGDASETEGGTGAGRMLKPPDAAASETTSTSGHSPELRALAVPVAIVTVDVHPGDEKTLAGGRVRSMLQLRQKPSRENLVHYPAPIPTHILLPPLLSKKSRQKMSSTESAVSGTSASTDSSSLSSASTSGVSTFAPAGFTFPMTPTMVSTNENEDLATVRRRSQTPLLRRSSTTNDLGGKASPNAANPHDKLDSVLDSWTATTPTPAGGRTVAPTVTAEDMPERSQGRSLMHELDERKARQRARTRIFAAQPPPTMPGSFDGAVPQAASPSFLQLNEAVSKNQEKRRTAPAQYAREVEEAMSAYPLRKADARVQARWSQHQLPLPPQTQQWKQQQQAVAQQQWQQQWQQQQQQQQQQCTAQSAYSEALARRELEERSVYSGMMRRDISTPNGAAVGTRMSYYGGSSGVLNIRAGTSATKQLYDVLDSSNGSDGVLAVGGGGVLAQLQQAPAAPKRSFTVNSEEALKLRLQREEKALYGIPPPQQQPAIRATPQARMTREGHEFVQQREQLKQQRRQASGGHADAQQQQQSPEDDAARREVVERWRRSVFSA